MYSQTTGEDNHGQPIQDNTDHLSKDLWKCKFDNAEHTFPWLLSFSLQSSFFLTQCNFTYSGCMCKYVLFTMQIPLPCIFLYLSPSLSALSVTLVTFFLFDLNVSIICFLIVKYYFCHQSCTKKESNRVLKTSMKEEKSLPN